MKFYKLTDDAVLTRYNPEKKNVFGGVGAEVVKSLKKGDIVLVNKVEPNTLDKSFIKGNNYYVSKKNFIAVSDYVNPLSDKIDNGDIVTFAYQKIKEPRTLIILGIVSAVIIVTKAIIKKI
jgi:hypothetical protein